MDLIHTHFTIKLTIAMMNKEIQTLFSALDYAAELYKGRISRDDVNRIYTQVSAEIK